MEFKLNHLDHALIELALTEDLGSPFQDLTQALFTRQTIKKARIISKHPEPIILCGLPVIKALMEKFQTFYQLESYFEDGQTINPGELILTIQAQPSILLMAERTILNFLQPLCAIATLTASYIALIQKTNLKLLDTRKTLPGLRHLSKYAVFCGGGVNHRMGLYDALMLKDTHIALLGGLEQALNVLPNHSNTPVIIEVSQPDELKFILDKGIHKIDRVLLDNMSLVELKECVAICQKRLPLEASGNINLSNILAIAQTGVDFASVGRLTHSAGNIDLSMKCDF